MRLTLEELRAMDDKQLGWHWQSGKWPFENMPGCHRCLVHHAAHWLGCKSHLDVTREATRLIPHLMFGEERVAFIREHLEEFIALRLFYDSLYPPAEVPAAEPAVAAAEQNIEETTARP